MRKIVPIIALAFIRMCSPSFAATGENPQSVFLARLGCSKAIIINGDDFGRTKWSNEGILNAIRNGVVTSTSLEVAANSAPEAYKIIKENPKLDVGVHLELARDDAPGNEFGPLSPLDKVPHLVDEKGLFLTSIDKLLPVPGDEIAAELEAQVKAAYDNGVDVTHLDCHKGFYHTYDRKSLNPTLKLARRYDLPIRWTGRADDPMLVKNGIVTPTRTFMIDMKADYENKKTSLISNIQKIKQGEILEVVLHPATGGLEPNESEWRKRDYRLMLDPDVKSEIEKDGVCLTGYRQLRDFQREWRKRNDAGK